MSLMTFMWIRGRALFICSLAVFAGLPHAVAFADPQVNRSGSRLDIRWSAAGDGAWAIRDAAGRTCFQGAGRSGQNEVRLDKVAAMEELEFEWEDTTGSDRVTIPGDVRLSPLVRPPGTAVIYQLQPRTYFAHGLGASEAGRLSELTTDRLEEIRQLGVDYIWLTGVVEHAAASQTDADVVKGEAGSYYAIYDYWDVSQQIGTLADFEALIERAHDVGLRILIDLVPNHSARYHRTDVGCKQPLNFGGADDTTRFFDAQNNYFYILNETFTPPDQHGLGPVDGVFDTDPFTPGIQLEEPARVTGNDIVSAEPAISDWFETAKLNYGYDFTSKRGAYHPRPRTWDQMIDVAVYWLQKGVDGFRVDYAHAVPLEFWRAFVQEVRQVQPEAFLLAEAYESDYRMRVPGFSYEGILQAGFDSVYNSAIYWSMHKEASRPGSMRDANPWRSPAMRHEILEAGHALTNYMENHDEVRVASRHFAPWVVNRDRRAHLGLAYTAYVGLLPSHLLIHGGQEVQEDASVFGPYAGDNGRTSIFDFIYQSQTRTWVYGSRPQWMVDFRERYRKLLTLKQAPPFSLRHSFSDQTFTDLDGANWYKEQSQWIGAYLRYQGDKRFLVVTNSDPFQSHMATIHFTNDSGHDPLGALAGARIENSGKRYLFREVFSRAGWVPTDPAIAGTGHPGDILFRSGGVPSGLHLGEVPAATTYVFAIEDI